ncbi:hypothetical protein GIB67_038535 [Kingdonia uniflora]|uniref:RING-type E3 ubiquitin transferase BRCA1 n=1 Tax=Kingdonia uniflora TaxID=39325 RepID=A0A7J7NQ37_9MAGN|nr:hypothetical protein GIB67_038535 [Kingdonia uniflora]
MEERILIRDQISHSPNKSSGHPIRGMSSVVATVSGYEGSERFKLIKLINETGASYVGALTKSTTHLVCFRLEGRKYDLAKEFGTNVVSHRWFEDCAIAGKRLPERRYFNQSGEQVGPLQSEVTIDRKKDNPLSRKKAKVLSYQSNTGNSSRARETDQRNLCPDSRFLNENSFPFSGTNDKISRKSKKSDLWNTWKQKFGSNSKQRSLERPLYDFDRVQHEEPSFYSSMVPGRQGDISSAINVDLEPTRKGRRLVKSNASRNISKSAILKFETNGICNQVRNISGETSHRSDDSSDENSLTVLDSDQECPSIEISNGPYSLNATSTSYRNETALPPQRTTLETGISNSENRNGELEDVRDDSNNITASNNSNNPVEDALSVENKTSKRSFSDYEDDMTRVKNNDNKFEEITCVICWTDFSSTRGVLPCGHRFCYSCIQQWADHMVRVLYFDPF